MRPRHECHYSEVPIATAYIIAHDRREKHPTAQKSHKKKISSSTKSPDISTIIDTRNGAVERDGAEAKR